MDTTFYACLQSSAKLISSASFLRFSIGHTEYTLTNDSSQYFYVEQWDTTVHTVLFDNKFYSLKMWE